MTAEITLADVGSLPPVLTISQAGALLGMGRSSAYQLLHEGRFPVPLLPVPGRRRVATAAVLELLGLPPFTASPEPGTDDEPLYEDFDDIT